MIDICKRYWKWGNEKIKNLDLLDMKLIKGGVFAFALMIAKLWPPILSLEWYWYGLIGAVLIARPVKKFYTFT